MGHTLDPVQDVMKAASLPTTFWMVRLQPIHPYLSVAIGLYLLLITSVIGYLRPSKLVHLAGATLMAFYCGELLLGLINIKLLAPIWLQMLHLVTADAMVASLTIFAAAAFTTGVVQVERSEPDGPKLQGMALVKQYIWLTKPRIISLLLVTTMTALFAGARGWPGFSVFTCVFIGGYLAAGSANAINMVLERDLDRKMERTRERPTVTEHVPTRRAFGFALILCASSFAILTCGANLLTAILALCGLVFYVSVYTLGLKRRTWQNIVIGGAAGAFPPLVGWAASQNALSPLAWILFGIVFLWTPVHFWALAILLKDDYAAAGVPMLPSVKGVKKTTEQIAVYTALTVAVTLAPFFLGFTGWTYAIAAVLLNIPLVGFCYKLYAKPERKEARGLFHYSMIYLALLFVAVAVDQSLPVRSLAPTSVGRVESSRFSTEPASLSSAHALETRSFVRVGAFDRTIDQRSLTRPSGVVIEIGCTRECN